ncbi:RnfABCDGE type electron transport complex subunit D [Thalassoporum mexicanum]|uniref:RnfABCDGE type electron transport complex subunit D n=2 Tax=Thalassoporum mexicanum TaxID=3457544 RepID=UPI001CED2080|nr:RnfABCDGE type electron transport complex subunit D [Pseudanabaena sp. PCC 7367]
MQLSVGGLRAHPYPHNIAVKKLNNKFSIAPPLSHWPGHRVFPYKLTQAKLNQITIRERVRVMILELQKLFKKVKQDARIYQILFLSSFLLLGIGSRDWTLKPGIVGVMLITCWVTQAIALFLLSWRDRLSFSPQHQEPKAKSIGSVNQSIATSFYRFISPLFSASITALAICLLLRSQSYSTMIFAGILAIGSKFMFRLHHPNGSGKHWFNPANFGIIAVLLLTNDAWISPGQWGEDWWYAILFLSAGGMVLKKVGRLDTTFAFLGTYALLEAVRNLYLGWTWDVFGHHLMSGSLLLFAFFMITDPRSIPNARAGRLVWAAAIALLSFVLRHQFYVPEAIFWALFAMSPLTIGIDYMWRSPRFNWFKPKQLLLTPHSAL